MIVVVLSESEVDIVEVVVVFGVIGIVCDVFDDVVIVFLVV